MIVRFGTPVGTQNRFLNCTHTHSSLRRQIDPRRYQVGASSRLLPGKKEKEGEKWPSIGGKHSEEIFSPSTHTDTFWIREDPCVLILLPFSGKIFCMGGAYGTDRHAFVFHMGMGEIRKERREPAR